MAALITLRGPYTVEGARWHLLLRVFSSSDRFKVDIEKQILLQESLDDSGDYKSFSCRYYNKLRRPLAHKCTVATQLSGASLL